MLTPSVCMSPRHLGDTMLEVDDIKYTIAVYGVGGVFDATADAEALEKARFALYRDVISWRYCGNPLGSKNRKRLPRCVERRIRMLFANPVCSEAGGCDYHDGCVAKGHYTGFKTAAQSAAEHGEDDLDRSLIE